MNDAIQFNTRQKDDMTEVMRITRDGVWVNPDMQVDDVAKAVLDALSYQVKVLVQQQRQQRALLQRQLPKRSWTPLASLQLQRK